MSNIGTGYDLSASQFSPEGRVFQVEYAQKAVQNSGTAVGLRGKNCVVLAVEKLVFSKLHEHGANGRIFNIDTHVGMAVAGLITDGRHIVETARTEASNYRTRYRSNIPAKHLNDRVSMYMHAYTLYSSVRPFGCSVIISAFEADGPALYMMDPSGVSYGYVGVAIGKGNMEAKAQLDSLEIKDMTSKQLVKEAARIIYLVHYEQNDKPFELELSWVGEETGGRHERVPKLLHEEAEESAKAAINHDFFVNKDGII